MRKDNEKSKERLTKDEKQSDTKKNESLGKTNHGRNSNLWFGRKEKEKMSAIISTYMITSFLLVYFTTFSSCSSRSFKSVNFLGMSTFISAQWTQAMISIFFLASRRLEMKNEAFPVCVSLFRSTNYQPEKLRTARLDGQKVQ